jgi:hypothetical protein
MKHLLNGVAIAAALVIAAPAWAQAPASSAAKAPAAAAPPAPMTGMASPQRHKRVRHMGHMAKRGSGGSQADQLNGQELARIQGGGTAPPMPPAASESPYGKAGQQR